MSIWISRIETMREKYQREACICRDTLSDLAHRLLPQPRTITLPLLGQAPRQRRLNQPSAFTSSHLASTKTRSGAERQPINLDLETLRLLRYRTLAAL